MLAPEYQARLERAAVEEWGLEEFRRRVGRGPVYMTQAQKDPPEKP